MEDRKYPIKAYLYDQPELNDQIQFWSNDVDSCSIEIAFYSTIKDKFNLENKTVSVVIDKSDGAKVTSYATVTGENTALWQLTTNELTVGTNKATIQVYSGTERLTFGTFKYKVLTDPEGGQVTSETNYPILVQLINDVQTALNSVSQTNENISQQELTRENNENSREQSENVRENNEQDRQFNEQTRQSNETLRQNNETDRINRFNTMTTEQQQDMEVVDARQGKATLRDNIQDIKSQLADIEQQKISKGQVSVADIDKNKGKFDQTYMTDEFLQQMAGITPINATPHKYSIVENQMSIPIILGKKSKNLFNKDTVTNGYYISSASGNLVANATYTVSDYIPVSASTEYTKKSAYQGAFFDSTETYISGFADGTTTFITPVNAVYVRYTLLPSQVETEQLELGSISTAYESHYSKLDSKTIPEKIITKDMLTFNPLEGVPSKNLFNKGTVTPKYYISHTDGNLSGGGTAMGYNASDWISVKAGTTIKKVSNDRYALYDVNKVFVSGSLTGTTIQITVDGYLRITVLDANLNTEQVEVGSISTSYEEYGVKLPSTKVRQSNNSIIVSPTIPSAFTNLSSAIASITDSSKDNPYTIYIHEGEYDVYSTLTASELSGIGILLPDYVHLVGVGDREKIILKMELADTTTLDESTRLSTLNVKKNNNLSNLTVIAKNCRYPIHADNSNSFKNYEQYIENCVFWHKGTLSGLWQACNAWGEGTASGAKEYFKSCVFRSDKLGGFSSHNNLNFTEPTYHQFDNCDFISALGYNSFNLLSMKSTKRCKVVLNNCRLTGFINHGENIAGSGMEFDITGSGNTFVPYKLTTTIEGEQPFIKFSDEIESNRNASGAIITRGTPIKYTGSGFGVTPMTTSDTKEKFIGICMQDCAIGDICYYKVKGYFDLTTSPVGTQNNGVYIGITSGALAVVADQASAIGKVMWNGGHLKLY